jgi:hypothetical protein
MISIAMESEVETAVVEWVDGHPYSKAWLPIDKRVRGGENGRGRQRPSCRRSPRERTARDGRHTFANEVT